jgi:hypothetical protein
MMLLSNTFCDYNLNYRIMEKEPLKMPEPPPLLIIREGIDPKIPRPYITDDMISGMKEWKMEKNPFILFLRKLGIYF